MCSAVSALEMVDEFLFVEWSEIDDAINRAYKSGKNAGISEAKLSL